MELCRLCQNKTEPRSQKKDKFSNLIHRGFDIIVEEDCSCCPLKVCENCRKDLQKYKKHYQHRKSAFPFKIRYVPTQHQANCNKGLGNEVQADTIDDDQAVHAILQQAADVAAKAHNFASWTQNNSLVYAKICMDAASPIQVCL